MADPQFFVVLECSRATGDPVNQQFVEIYSSSAEAHDDRDAMANAMRGFPYRVFGLTEVSHG